MCSPGATGFSKAKSRPISKSLRKLSCSSRCLDSLPQPRAAGCFARFRSRRFQLFVYCTCVPLFRPTNIPAPRVRNIRPAAGFYRVLGGGSPLCGGQESLLAVRITGGRAQCGVAQRACADHVESTVGSASAFALRILELPCRLGTLAPSPRSCAARRRAGIRGNL